MKKKTAVMIPANSYCKFYTFKDKIRQLRKLNFNLCSNWAPSLFIYVVASSCHGCISSSRTLLVGKT